LRYVEDEALSSGFEKNFINDSMPNVKTAKNYTTRGSLLNSKIFTKERISESMLKA
jgi:hypothetical protein